jgi:hypothetical protein
MAKPIKKEQNSENRLTLLMRGVIEARTRLGHARAAA